MMLRNGIARAFSSSAAARARNVVLVDGCRIPFTMGGTVYGKYLAVDLQRMALAGLLNRTALDPATIDYLFCGTVIQETRTSNIAREAGMGAGIPVSVPSHTITQACISSNQCLTTGAEKIIAGAADIVMIGGVETFSGTYSTLFTLLCMTFCVWSFLFLNLLLHPLSLLLL